MTIRTVTSHMIRQIIGALLLLIIIGIVVFINFFYQNKHINNISSQIQSSHTTVLKKNEVDINKQIYEMQTQNVKKYGNNISNVDLAGTVLNKYFGYINSCNYQEAYKMMDTEYIEDFRITLDTFIIRYSYTAPKIPVVLNITNLTDRYLVELLIENDVASEEELNDPAAEKKCIFTIVKRSTGYFIMDEGIMSSSSINSVKKLKNPDVKYTIKRAIELYNGVACIIELKNIGSDTIKIIRGANSVYGHGTKDCKGEFINPLPEDYILNPGNIKEFFVLFKTAEELAYISIKLDDGRSIRID